MTSGVSWILPVCGCGMTGGEYVRWIASLLAMHDGQLTLRLTLALDTVLVSMMNVMMGKEM